MARPSLIKLVVLVVVMFSILTAASAAVGQPDLCGGGGGVISRKGKVAVARCTINCFRYDPVCGANGVTYGCGCPDAACAGVRVVKLGPC
ncbi:hypothetical protein LINPERHAP2_LOCUS21286 [Linum perenne]